MKAKEIARARVKKLLDLAFSEENEERARRYVELAKRIAMRNRVRIPKEYKRWICKNCNAVLLKGNAKIRVEKGIIKLICMRCGYVKIIPWR